MKLYRCRNSNNSQTWIIADSEQQAKEYAVSIKRAKEVNNVKVIDFSEFQFYTRKGLEELFERITPCEAGMWVDGENSCWKAVDGH